LEQIRTFIAIELPDEVKEKISFLQEELREDRGGASRVRPKNIHLTLKFLGNIDAEKINSIGNALEKASENVGPLTVTVGGTGGFPNLKSPRVLWVGVGESEGLTRLQKNIEEELNKIGFEKERRPFHPHLTLLRVKSMDEGRRLAGLVKEIKSDIEAKFSTDEFILFKSKLGPGGAEHSALKRISLKGGSR
jgi:2'-5' RNA ligase